MSKNGKVGFLYAISQLHAGKGFDSGVVDLPIQREVHTDFPIISGIKGAFRNEFEDAFGKNEDIKIFGSPKEKEKGTEDQSGSVSFSEAKIFLFPVRSITEGFVWITCPMILSRLNILFKMLGNEALEAKVSNLLKTIKSDKEYYSSNKPSINIEEYKVTPEYSKELVEFLDSIKEISPDEILQNKLKEKVLIVSDEDFRFFVKGSTEVMARIKINNKKGVAEQGGLWYEEYLPQDTVMYFIAKTLLNDHGLDKLTNTTDKQFVNIGGKSTTGKGFTYIKYL
ncbi:type III-B CRISPR module RAMP protein Cmr4 [Oceanotoga sp. DSM 15011]|uniref:type III-B CRISPR module RAMP protein Cmr4 n=1 Tax=Oceanotoga sp. DSM 15011 TaxID=2984951 RepID=UPI0021F46FF8|nr:type III-B CRISPR module RAMP protein Cmr4 [Oceanotoga sp. DSM 15011]UYP01296.1 type III-B CRISPR module RAMP protein Cmr4 [Oceanotoga sp. DSM 15011]